MTKLVKIDAKTGTHTAYDGKNAIAAVAFDRPLSAEEVEYLRKYPLKYVQALEEMTEEGSAPEPHAA